MWFYICAVAAALILIIFTAYYIYQRKHDEGDGNLIRFFPFLLITMLVITLILFLPYYIYLKRIKPDNSVPLWLAPPYLALKMLQSVSTDTDYEFISEILGAAGEGRLPVSPAFAGVYSAVLCYIMGALPFSAILTVMDVFRTHTRYWKALNSLTGGKDYYVFNELNSKSVNLARSIKENAEKPDSVCFFFCNMEEERDQSLYAEAEVLKSVFTPNTPAAVLKCVKRNHSLNRVHFYFLGNTDQNIEDATDILKRVEKLAIEDGCEKSADSLWWKSKYITLDLMIERTANGNVLDARYKYGVFTRMLIEEETLADDLLLHYPLCVAWQPAGSEKQTVNVVVIGNTNTAKEVFRKSIWMGQMRTMGLRVSYVGDDADRFEKELRFKCPALFDRQLAGGMTYSLSFVKADLYDLKLGAGETGGNAFCGDSTARDRLKTILCEGSYIVVAGEDDDENIEAGMYLRTYLARTVGPGHNERVFMGVLVKNSQKANRLSEISVQESTAGYRLNEFGTDQRVFSCVGILNEQIAENLLKIQIFYSQGRTAKELTKEQRRDGMREVNKSFYNYRSSFACSSYSMTRIFDSGVMRREFKDNGRYAGDISALHMCEELYDILFKLKSAQERKEIARRYEAALKDADLLEELARVEHSRWVSYMIVSGWVSMKPEEVKKWVEVNGGDHKDYLGQRHPCITSWENLAGISLIKSRWTADKLGGTPSREWFYDNDRAMVRETCSFMQ